VLAESALESEHGYDPPGGDCIALGNERPWGNDVPLVNVWSIPDPPVVLILMGDAPAAPHSPGGGERTTRESAKWRTPTVLRALTNFQDHLKASILRRQHTAITPLTDLVKGL